MAYKIMRKEEVLQKKHEFIEAHGGLYDVSIEADRHGTKRTRYECNDGEEWYEAARPLYTNGTIQVMGKKNVMIALALYEVEAWHSAIKADDEDTKISLYYYEQI